MATNRGALEALRIDRKAEEPRGSRARLWIGLGVPVLALALGLAWWLARPAAAVVRTAVVHDAGGAVAGAVLNASGYVTARRQATVSSKVTGKVADVLIEEGMAVKEGQVLARLDTLTARAGLDLAESQLAASRRSLLETEVRLRQAEITRQRQRKLIALGVNTQADVDAADAEADAQRARLALGRQEIEVARRQVDVRRRDIDDTVIRAPFSGVVTTKDAQPGEMISPVSAGGGFTRTGIGTLVDMTSLEIDVDVNESYINRVRPGQHAEAVLDAYPDWQIPSTVIAIVPAADKQKATVKVRLAFDRLDPRILPDMGIKVAFLGDAPARGAEIRPQARVPRAALRQDHGRQVVFVVHAGRAERRAVRVGEAPGDEVAVIAGLAAGEQVVVDGPPDLTDGRQVIVR